MITNLVKKVKGDYYYRTVLFSLVSLVIDVGCIIYYGVMARIQDYGFFAAYSFYYCFIILARSAILGLCKIYKSEKSQLILNIITAALLLGVAATLSPITVFIAIQGKAVSYGDIGMITFSTIIFYKMTMAIYNYVKTRKMPSVVIKTCREINLADTFVSFLPYQAGMILTFGADDKQFALIMNIALSIGIFLAIVIISFVMIINSVKIIRKQQYEKYV